MKTFNISSNYIFLPDGRIAKNYNGKKHTAPYPMELHTCMGLLQCHDILTQMVNTEEKNLQCGNYKEGEIELFG